ncbi:MAG: hypothetical protein QXR48_02265 [Candidatus Woesearchaeota archaeon]
MDKSIMLAGIFAVIAIVGIVLFVNNTITGKVVDYPSVYYPYNNIYADDFYVKPTGVRMDVASGVVFLRPDQVINNVCMNTVKCYGLSDFVCCKHDGTECVIPPKEYRDAGTCPLTHRSKCQCKEDYIAGLVEKYG